MLTGDFSPHVDDAIKQFLKKMHADNAARPIRYPLESGAFPNGGYGALLHGESLVVVPDTNILLQDLAQACRAERRLTLVNAANVGALRLFCAEHVIDEMYDRIKRDASRLRVSYDDLLARWEDEYLPLLRVVPNDTVSESMLTSAERRRVRHLLASKDVPSVKLALALGALYLTEDQGARWAVYDERATAEELLKWVAPLQDGGSAEVLGNAAFIVILVPTITMWRFVEIGKTLASEAPWLFWPGLAVGLGFVLAKTTMGGMRQTISGVGTAFEAFMECMRPYYEALERFRAVAPTMPSWAQLSSEIGRREVLLRASIWNLARYPAGDASALELSQRLPDLDVGQGPNLVRSALRESACFHQTSRGRWQLGRPDWRAPRSGSV
jgi:predicted nucleic acid-binding protein